MTGAQIERERKKKQSREKRLLCSEDYDDWLDIVRRVTLSREDVKSAMGFAMDNAECAEDVLAVLLAGLLRCGAPWPARIARLYVLSDILLNAGAAVKNVSKYR